MTFKSNYSDRIWGSLYKVYIPDYSTLNPDYIRKFGVHVTQDKEIDAMIKTNFTMVMIDVATILGYFNQGTEIQIPSREDMIKMHKDIELYLSEWKEYIRLSIHGGMDAQNHKELIISLEKLSKYIYEKAKPRELIDNLFLNKKNPLGLVNPIQQHMEQNKEIVKRDYESIRHLIKNKKSNGDSGGRF